MTAARRKPLELNDIQGNIIRGYRLPHVAHLFGTIESHQVPDWRTALRQLSQYVTPDNCKQKPGVTLNVGLSCAALESLLPELSGKLAAFDAYEKGMGRRAGLLGDPQDERWAVWNMRHVWISIHSADTSRLERAVERVMAEVPLPLCNKRPHGEALVENDHWVEHFGFRDDVSQPAVAGAPNMERALRGGGKLNDARDAWLPIEPGDFLLGYPNERGVDVLEGLPAPVAQIFRNGTFAAFRELQQDVSGFRGAIAENAARWKMAPDDLAARIFGRRADGDSLAEPGEKAAFSYHDDPNGKRCPLGSHVRRVNPRTTGEHRLIRRGMPFGPWLPKDAPGDQRSRGMYFIGLNASIEDQFEFMQATWMNGSVGRLPGSVDPMAGAAGKRQGRMLIEGDAGASRDPIVLELPRFVSCLGGQYYFVPGIRGLRRIAGLPEAEAERSAHFTLEQS